MSKGIKRVLSGVVTLGLIISNMGVSPVSAKSSEKNVISDIASDSSVAVRTTTAEEIANDNNDSVLSIDKMEFIDEDGTVKDMTSKGAGTAGWYVFDGKASIKAKNSAVGWNGIVETQFERDFNGGVSSNVYKLGYLNANGSEKTLVLSTQTGGGGGAVSGTSQTTDLPRYRYTITSVEGGGDWTVGKRACKSDMTLRWKRKKSGSIIKEHLLMDSSHKDDGRMKHVKKTHNGCKCWGHDDQDRIDMYGATDSREVSAIYNKFEVKIPEKVDKNKVKGTITIKFRVWDNQQIADVDHAISWNGNKGKYTRSDGWSGEKSIKLSVSLTTNYKKVGIDSVNYQPRTDDTILLKERTTLVKDQPTGSSKEVKLCGVYRINKCLERFYNKYLYLEGYNKKNYKGQASMNVGYFVDNEENEPLAVANYVRNNTTNLNGVSFASAEYTDMNGNKQTFSTVDELQKATCLGGGSFDHKICVFNKEGHYVLNFNDKVEGDIFSADFDIDDSSPEYTSNASQWSYKSSSDGGDAVLFFSEDAVIEWTDVSDISEMKAELIPETGNPITYYNKSGSKEQFKITDSGMYRITATDSVGNTTTIYANVDKTKPAITALDDVALSYRLESRTTSGGDETYGDLLAVDSDLNEESGVEVVMSHNDIPLLDGQADIELANYIVLYKKSLANTVASIKSLYDAIATVKTFGAANRTSRDSFINAVKDYAYQNGSGYTKDGDGNILDGGKIVIESKIAPTDDRAIREAVFGIRYGMMLSNTGMSVRVFDQKDSRKASDTQITGNSTGIAKIDIVGGIHQAHYEAPEWEDNATQSQMITAYQDAYKGFVEGGSDFMTITEGMSSDAMNFGSFAFTIREAGEYEISITDRAGNETTQEIYVNTSVPIIDGVIQDGIYPSAVTTNFIYEDESNFLFALIDGIRYRDLTYTFKDVPRNDGWHTVMLFSRNIATVPRVDFQIDLRDPVVEKYQGNASYVSIDPTLFADDKGGIVSEDKKIHDGDAFKGGVKFFINEYNPNMLMIDGCLSDIGTMVESSSSAKDTGAIWKRSFEGRYIGFYATVHEFEEEGWHTIFAQDEAGRSTDVNVYIDCTGPTVEFSGGMGGKELNTERGTEGEKRICFLNSVYASINDEYALAEGDDVTKFDVMDKDGNWVDVKEYGGTYDNGSISYDFVTKKVQHDKLMIGSTKDGDTTYEVQYLRMKTTDLVGNLPQMTSEIPESYLEDDGYIYFAVYHLTTPSELYEDMPVEEIYNYTENSVKEVSLKVSCPNRPDVYFDGETDKGSNHYPMLKIGNTAVDEDGYYKEGEWYLIDDVIKQSQAKYTFSGLNMVMYPESSVSYGADIDPVEVTEVKLSVAANSIYNKSKTLKVDNTDVTVTYTSSSGKSTVTNVEKGGTTKLSNDGIYTLSYLDSEDEVKEACYTIDKTKPTIKVGNSSVKKGLTVKKGTTVKVADATSGLTKVTLNGKSAGLSGKVKLKKAGNNTIVAKDAAGNSIKKVVKVKSTKKSSKKNNK